MSSVGISLHLVGARTGCAEGSPCCRGSLTTLEPSWLNDAEQTVPIPFDVFTWNGKAEKGASSGRFRRIWQRPHRIDARPIARLDGTDALNRKQRSQKCDRRPYHSQRIVEGKGMGKGRRADHGRRALFSLVLFACGGLSLRMAQASDAVVRRFLGPTIRSAAALQQAELGQPVLLPGRIGWQTWDLERGFAICDREHLGPGTPVYRRIGAPGRAPLWVPQGRHHPPFTLVTGEARVPIINGGYAIERARSRSEIGSDRYAGFMPGDEVLVIGEIDPGGVAALKVFGGTPDEFRKTLLLKQRILIPAGRVLGCLFVVLGLVLAAPWVRTRMRAPLPLSE